MAQAVRHRLGARSTFDSRRSSGTATLDDFPLEELRAVHRLVAVLSDLGAARASTRRSSTIRSVGARGEEAVRRRPGDCSTRSSREKLLTGPRRVWLLAGGVATATTSWSLPTRAVAENVTRFHTLRQQWERKGTRAFLRAGRFHRPARQRPRRTILGAFAVTAGIGCDELAAKFEADHDDYNSIMVKALADRLAEAFAEWLHQQARARLGLRRRGGADERGADRRKVPRHPPRAGLSGLPRPHRKADAVRPCSTPTRHTGIQLTENFAMHPAASVSGLYFAHPEARYFAVDRITRDQVEDYARRKGMTLAEVERWLAPNLGYEPED